MTEHKMRVIDGVRYRPEDVDQARLRQRRRSGPLSTRTAHTPPAPTGPFHPAGATVEQVLEYLDGADYVEATRVLVAEEAGKARSTILGKREEILAAKEVPSNGDPSGAAG